MHKGSMPVEEHTFIINTNAESAFFQALKDQETEFIMGKTFAIGLGLVHDDIDYLQATDIGNIHSDFLSGKAVKLKTGSSTRHSIW